MKIAIASGKGGTGKTSVSANFASYLSEKHKVVLVDLDVEEPNSGLFLDKTNLKSTKVYKHIPTWDAEKCTACGLCQDVCNFHAIIKLGETIIVSPELCHSCFACSELCPQSALPMNAEETGLISQSKTGHLNFVEGRLNIGEEQATPLIKATKDYVSKNFDDDYIKIFDAPPGTSCSMIEATKDADFVILVTEPTPFGLNDVILAIDTMKALGKPFGLVINKFGIGNDDIIDYCQKEHITILTKINNDRKVAELYAKGQLWHQLEHMNESLKNIEQHLFKPAL
jgi:MinD superfamily P-loop ATPase